MRCAVLLKELDGNFKSLFSYLQECIDSGPSVIRIPGWFEKFWAKYSPVFPTEIVIIVNIIIIIIIIIIITVRFLLGNSPASEFYMTTFRNTLFHLHRQVGMKNDWG